MTTYSALQLKNLARAAGFAACGIAPAGRVAPWREAQLRKWLADGRQGAMRYMQEHLDLRLDPTLLVPGARSVVSVALNYCPMRLQPEGTYRFARYAYGRDYHDVMRQKLRSLAERLGLQGRAFCDTAPLDEHYWAWRGGLGWLGRHTQLILPGAGSYFFLGELVLTAEADAYDEPMPSRCGTCRACIQACPAGALSADGGIDARRCLSYLTIEWRGPLPSGTAALMGHCVYGCDRCAEACPHNRLARPTAEPALQPRPEFLNMTAAGWRALTPEDYRRIFKGSAVKRAKYEGLMRNIRAAAAADEGTEA